MLENYKINWFLIDIKKTDFSIFRKILVGKISLAQHLRLILLLLRGAHSPGMSRAYLKHTPTSIELFLLHVKQPYGEIVGDFLRKFVGKKWRAL